MAKIIYDKLIHNKRIKDFLLRREQPYWTKYKFGSKYYIMSFQFDIWEVIK